MTVNFQAQAFARAEPIRRQLIEGEVVPYAEMHSVNPMVQQAWWTDGIDGRELRDDPEAGGWYLTEPVDI